MGGTTSQHFVYLQHSPSWLRVQIGLILRPTIPYLVRLAGLTRLPTLDAKPASIQEDRQQLCPEAHHGI